MKRLLSSVSLTFILSLSAAAPIVSIATINQARAAEDSGLYYNFGDKKISLSVRNDTIAVVMKKPKRGPSALSLLRNDFSDTPTRSTRGGAKSSSTTQIQALGGRYAVLTATNDAQGAEKLKEKAESKPYIEATLPVLKLAGKSTSLVLPNEMIVSFQPNISSAERTAILASNNLGNAKELPFATGFYTVVPQAAKGLEVLAVSNRLSKVKGIESSMPNFIEIKSAPDNNIFSSNETGSPKKISSKSNTERNLKTLQWHIDSQPMMKEMGLGGGRTDVRAPEAWGRGKKGDGVLVAVIDNLIQWDHPALKDSIATVNCQAQTEVACLKDENHGWDFSNSDTDGDNDTRVSVDEVSALRPDIDESLKSDEYLQTKYAPGIARVKTKKPELTDSQILVMLRDSLRGKVVSSFHGTMSTGMIVGNASNGFQGIAPNVKILPVRAGGLGGSLSMKSVLISMAYAAVRGADVINMSFGSDTPSPAEAKMLERLQKLYPKLVFVAAAGNENTSNPAYPASYPGIISVGAINVKGNRASYSNYGQRINVVAPGGDPDVDGGVLTLSGVGADGFWTGVTQPTGNFIPFQDRRGYYVFTEGTSFASPAVVGVVALMKSADPQRKLTAKQYGEILMATSSRESLSLTTEEKAIAQKQKAEGNGSMTGEQFFFGNGLVNAEQAVAAVEKMQR